MALRQTVVFLIEDNGVSETFRMKIIAWPPKSPVLDYGPPKSTSFADYILAY